MKRYLIPLSLALTLVLAACGQSQPAAQHDALRLGKVLGGASAAGFARADRVRPFAFPADHGPHPHYRSEWWYFTGNLQTADGRRFGYQWTLFRFALAPKVPNRASHWATNQVYMAHFTVTDAQAQRFHWFEKLERGALGLAGAEGQPLHLWIDDWKLDTEGDHWKLHAQGNDGSRLDLSLTPVKPIVLQGDAGLSRKSDAPGNASYYYSVPRLRSQGELTIGGQQYAVQGVTWMDREWSTSALGAEQSGWDWFSLHLDDGYDLMFYRLRRKDGSIDEHSNGTLIDPKGNAVHLNRDQVQSEVLSRWRSDDGTDYPARWRIQIPSAQLDVEVQPVLADQELHGSVRYWEGAVDVHGSHRGQRVQGRGYMELAGYGDDRPMGLEE